MRRIQIHIDEDLDDAAAKEAASRGISKAAFIRSCLARVLNVEANGTTDPWEDMIGWLDDEPVQDIDDVVYGER